MAQKLGISVNTYAKYLKDCLSLKLAEKRGSGIVFLKLSHSIETLFGDNEQKFLKAWKHNRFFAGVDYKGNKSFKAILERIKYSVAEQNYKQQSYHISKEKKILDFSKNRTKLEANTLKKLYNKYGVHSFDNLISILSKQEFSIRTGKFHLAKLLNCSHSSATRYLKKWNNLFFIRNKVNKVFNLPINISSYEYILSLGYKYVSVYKGKLIANLGSKLSLITTSNLIGSKNEKV